MATQRDFEFQRLHGMGEALHDHVLKQCGTRCRIYAPVGEHQDLLAYLVRRLLENGANSSFVNQIVDTSITPEAVARDPVDTIESLAQVANPRIPLPAELYGDSRINSKGWDITDLNTLQAMHELRQPLNSKRWKAKPIVPGIETINEFRTVINPADPGDEVGQVSDADATIVGQALQVASHGFADWSGVEAKRRVACLRQIADLYEANSHEFFALLAREAGKTWLDAVGELREAVDFARYYAQQLRQDNQQQSARGVIVCISPWNFPLAIFSGQIFAALAAGNCVIAKPAEQTSLIAALAVRLMHRAGVPETALQLLPGPGTVVGAALCADSRVAGVCFTGSTATAMHINRSMAKHLAPDAPLIAETGGLNAMLVDSTALPEQVVRDVLTSAFQSAGQRCSAVRMLYLQEDIADKMLEMLFGAMDELCIGNPWNLKTDVGPVIDQLARDKIIAHCDAMAKQGRVLKTLSVPEAGIFVAPTVIELSGIDQLEEEIFGPVLHVARFAADQIDSVVDDVNARGYGLTFGMHTRVDSRVEQLVQRIQVGNIYVNRNQIGAVVGTQPFGGEGLSGTGPKAGGPAYLKRFFLPTQERVEAQSGEIVGWKHIQPILNRKLSGNTADIEAINRFAAQQGIENRFDSIVAIERMPGPTGETNQLSIHPRGQVLCLGPDSDSALKQALIALAQQNRVTIVATGASVLAAELSQAGFDAAGLDGQLDAAALETLSGFDLVLSQANNEVLRGFRKALAQRNGPLIPLVCGIEESERLVLERHLCIDTTAAGGNASLIAAGS